ncbi:MAG: Biopolymer transport protein ExbD/TolR [Candidatus Methanoperedenaceae archaeon GB50]|nr:MAG: Biopolymer transport protein ExbD/TolR [Candidatus Methanoperedenaceae archaeon GB50]HEC49619.1 biopolymer transporter ExbD [Candidatus Desulfofervidus auxilii]
MIEFKKKTLKLEFNLTPLIDMVFLLLIFFLLTANFLREEGISVRLPYAKTATPIQKTEELTVYLTAKGETFLGKKQVSLEQVYQIFCHKIKETNYLMVTIKADKATPIEWVVRVIDRARLAGVRKIFIVTDRKLKSKTIRKH